MSGGTATEAEARVAFELVREEIQSYPWEAAGVPCWCASIRLSKSKSLNYTYRVTVVVGLGYGEHYICKLPPHVPNPFSFDRIPGVSCGWGGFGHNSIGEDILELWVG